MDEQRLPPPLQPGGGPESRIFHWLDHAVATLWFLSHAPAPDGGELTYEQAWELIAVTGGTLRFLAAEYDDPRAGHACECVFDALRAFEREGPAAGRREAAAAAQDLAGRMLDGVWPGDA